MASYGNLLITGWHSSRRSPKVKLSNLPVRHPCCARRLCRVRANDTNASNCGRCVPLRDALSVNSLSTYTSAIKHVFSDPHIFLDAECIGQGQMAIEERGKGREVYLKRSGDLDAEMEGTTATCATSTRSAMFLATSTHRLVLL